jgi:hypothetical protein
MTELFDMYERLFRAVYPPNIMPLFWKEDGQLSSAAFKDKKGLSVERDGGRDEKTVIDTMRLFFYGNIIYLIVRDCEMCNAVVKYLPSQRSVFHYDEEMYLGEKVNPLKIGKARLQVRSCHR